MGIYHTSVSEFVNRYATAQSPVASPWSRLKNQSFVIKFLPAHLFHMPLYEYQCRKCGHTFELLRRMQDPDDRIKCPHGRSTRVERQFSSFAAAGCGKGGSGKFT